MAITWKTIKNNAQTTLDANLSDVATSMTVVDASLLPTTFPFYATIWNKTTYPDDPGDDPNMEIILVDSSGGGNVLNITRGQDDTSDTSHSNGDTVANLFNAATLTQVRDEIDATDWVQVVDVDPTNGDYQTIKDAVDSITDSSSTKTYTVRVHPGIYTEDNPITLPDFVSILGEQQRQVIVKPSNASTHVFEMANRCEIKSMTINAGGVASITGILCDDATVSRCRVTNFSFKDCETGVLLDNSGTEMYLSRINGRGTFTELFKVTDGLMDFIDVIVGDTLTTTTLFKAEGSNSNMNIIGATINSSNITNAVYADDGAQIDVFSTEIKNTTNGLRLGSTGASGIRAFSVSMPSTTTYDLLIESATAEYEGSATCINRDKLSIASGATVLSLGFDHALDKMRALNNFAVGMDGSGNSAQIGEGGGYQKNVKVYSYNGATYTDVTSDDPIQFANNSVNTALYFGDLDSYDFYALKYKMGDTAIDLGTGAIVWEYYDGGVVGWVEFNTLNTRTAFSNSQNGESFTGTDGKTYDVRFDHDLKNGVVESNVNATGWIANSVNGDTGYWVRCRISTAITTSPKISDVFLKGNYMSIRKNGTQSYHGDARPEIWGLGEFGANNASAANSALSVSTNIDYPFSDNTLANNADDELYWRVPVDSGMDTSSGITIELELCTNVAPGTTQTAKLHFFSAIMPQDSTFDGSSTEVEQAFDFTATAGDAAYLSNRYVMTNRIDISSLTVGDVIYCSLQREKNEAGDDLSGNVFLSNAIYKYVSWQNGIHNE